MSIAPILSRIAPNGASPTGEAGVAKATAAPAKPTRLTAADKESIAQAAYFRWAARCSELMVASSAAITADAPDAGDLVDEYGRSVGYLVDLLEFVGKLSIEAAA